jgi:hypothetical protein
MSEGIFSKNESFGVDFGAGNIERDMFKEDFSDVSLFCKDNSLYSIEKDPSEEELSSLEEEFSRISVETEENMDFNNEQAIGSISEDSSDKDDTKDGICPICGKKSCNCEEQRRLIKKPKSKKEKGINMSNMKKDIFGNIQGSPLFSAIFADEETAGGDDNKEGGEKKKEDEGEGEETVTRGKGCGKKKSKKLKTDENGIFDIFAEDGEGEDDDDIEGEDDKKGEHIEKVKEDSEEKKEGEGEDDEEIDAELDSMNSDLDLEQSFRSEF